MKDYSSRIETIDIELSESEELLSLNLKKI